MRSKFVLMSQFEAGGAAPGGPDGGPPGGPPGGPLGGPGGGSVGGVPGPCGIQLATLGMSQLNAVGLKCKPGAQTRSKADVPMHNVYRVQSPATGMLIVAVGGFDAQGLRT